MQRSTGHIPERIRKQEARVNFLAGVLAAKLPRENGEHLTKKELFVLMEIAAHKHRDCPQEFQEKNAVSGFLWGRGKKYDASKHQYPSGPSYNWASVRHAAERMHGVRPCFINGAKNRGYFNGSDEKVRLVLEFSKKIAQGVEAGIAETTQGLLEHSRARRKRKA